MTDAVIDSSAILAFVLQEPGGAVAFSYKSVRACAVNHAEVVGKLIDLGLDDVTIEAALRPLACTVVGLDSYRAHALAGLRRNPKARALSLGDRACLSLALQTCLPVLTADRAWSGLELGIDVRLIR